jgi:putative transcriptional regulator
MRNIGEESRRSFAGSLLVAHPSMLDPNFRRAVLFISAHDPDDGALGVIINRPLDKRVAELVTEMPPEGLADVPVFFGGPVERNQLMFATFEWQKGEGAFVGYAGWGAGQLEAEMKQKAWIVQEPSRAALKPERLSKLWFEIMRGLGPWYKMLAAAPDDPSLT